MKKPVLVITIAGDFHANVIEWAVRQQKWEVNRWVVTDYPTRDTLSWHSDREADIQFPNSFVGDYNSVWLRRFWPSRVPDYVHKDDASTAANQIESFRQSLLEVISPDALWVNPASTLKRSGEKLPQLKLAQGIGFNIPTTLITNDLNQLKDFYRSNNGNVIYKPLRPMIWQGESNRHVTYTTSIDESYLHDEKPLRACPGIFQKNLPKAYEVRATFIGKNCFAARLNSQGTRDVEQDWRHAVNQKKQLVDRPINLPEEIYEHCLELMVRLNIVYGAFDFIVTPDGDYYFLEVNTGGQFLWVEAECPSIPLVQAFTEFLISGDPEYQWSGNIDQSLSLSSYLSSETYQDFKKDPNQGHLPYQYPLPREL